jgi:hypothetical protein
MNLLQVRTQFIKQSGRYDLVVDTIDYVDNGANIYIQRGQKWLEKQVDFAAQKGKVFRKLSIGKFYCTFKDMRTIDTVWIGDTTERIKLDYLSYDEMVEEYPTAFVSTTNAKPVYWSPICVRNPNMDSDSDTDGIVEFMDVIENSDEYNAIVCMPPANGNYHIEIHGKFMAKKLTLDADSNWWTVNEEEILIMAAMRALETAYRNSQGVNDWTNSISSALFGLEKDFIENDTNQIVRLEG